MPPSLPDKNLAATGSDFGRHAGLGLQFVGTLALLGGLGWWLDGKWGTGPWLLVVGIFLGSIVAFITIVKSVPPAKAVHVTKPYLEDDEPKGKKPADGAIDEPFSDSSDTP
jgi:ATP synthase protein I